MTFQTQVGVQPAPGVEGDFCSANPRYSVLAGQNALVAGRLGAVVARFAWLSYEIIDNDGAPGAVNNFGSGMPAGLIHREQQGLITRYLDEASLVVPAGMIITVMDSVELWVKNRGATQALVGQKCYANFSDGSASFAAAGAPGTATSSAATIAASTFSVTGSVSGNIMSVTAVGSGTVQPGSTISGTGVATGSKVVSQLLPLLSGETLGGVGRYALSIAEQTAASTTIAGTYGTLTVGGTIAGAFGPGDVISGAGVVAGTSITQQVNGSPGGAGDYVVDNNTVVGSSIALTANINIETKYIARSSGLPGELVKISPIAY